MSFTNLAIVDIETTGGNARHDRIIEIGLLLVDDGVVTKTWSTLVNPGQRIDPYITLLTGIRQEEVETAPTFEDISAELWEMLKDRTFVAHFARFDYSFIKQEFLRLENNISLQQLCSVKLSRKLFPQVKGHGLDSIINRFQFHITNRHRAFDDAEMIWQFFQKVTTLFSPEEIDKAIKAISQRPSLPTYISAEQIDKLPSTFGVYIFYDDKGCPIYVGKSVNIKDRVKSHFYADLVENKEMKIKENVRFIETVTTSGELEALLKESQMIKELKPVYNRKLRRVSSLVYVQQKNVDGYLSLSFGSSPKLSAEDLESTIAVFRSKREAENQLKKLAEEYSLCWKLLGLEKCQRGCFHYQLGFCHGACVKKEEPAVYNARLETALHSFRLASWKFSGPIAVIERNPLTDQQSIHIFHKWCHVKTLADETELVNFKVPKEKNLSFDLDNYKILRLAIKQRRLTFMPLETLSTFVETNSGQDFSAFAF